MLIRFKRCFCGQPLRGVLGDLDDDAGWLVADHRARVESFDRATTVNTVRIDETDIREWNGKAVYARVILSDRFIGCAGLVSRIVIFDVLCGRADRGGVGSTLHYSFNQVPVS